MDSNKIKIILVVVMAAFAAVYLGIAAATAQMEAVGWVAGALVLTVCLSLGNRIWLLLPLMTNLGLFLPLPGNFSSTFLTQVMVIGFCGLLFLSRRLPINFRMTALEVWCLLFFLCVAQAYLRNPVGLAIFGGDMVGGKPYAVFGVMFGTAVFLSMLAVDPNDFKWWVRLSLIGAIGNFGLGTLAKFSPTFGYFLGASFSTDVDLGEEIAKGQATRVSFVRGISTTVALWIASRVSPLAACFKPMYAPLILLTLALAAASGFRSQIGYVLVIYFFGVCYRGGFMAILASFLIASTLLILLTFVNSVAPLPPNIQRSLSFLPGTWEEQYVRDGAGSTEWRIEMWKEALLTDKWISNKFLGDGLGFSSDEFQIMQAINTRSRSVRSITGLTAGQETMMISGGYHSGPIQTIRTVGYLGLAVLLIGFYRLIVHAHRQILRTRGTEWFATTLFICLPFIYGPLSWTFIIGSFEGGAGILLLGSAMVRMLEKNLPLPAYVSGSRREPYVLLQQRRALAEAP